MRAMISQRFVVGIAGVATILLIGCAQPPSEQLGAAQKAVDAAKAAGATEYAKEDFTALEQQFVLAKDELANQDKALSIFRSYTDADKMLIKVVEAGGSVAAKAAHSKEAAKTAAEALEKDAQQVVASAKELIAKTPTGKERAAVEVIKQDVAGLEGSLSVVHQLIEKKDYLGAEAQAKSVKEEGAALSMEIQSAIDKTKGKKPASRG
ncbi:MAG: hypothetical protein KGJ82_19600 [Nitrospirota bacterium]|nr:hypothetical protein [Nitrospirota bacterium]